jgi:DNA repair and recombination protein RAD52
MFTEQQKAELSAKLDKSHVKERTQAGRKLSYVEGWHAIGRDNPRDGWGVSYIAKVRVIVDGVTREGIGAGHGIDVDLGLAHESAIKEAETDAMKRALMTFGNPFGLALYDKTQENVETNSAPAPGRNAPAAVNRTSSAGATLFVTDRMIAAVSVLDNAADIFKWWNLPAVQEAFNALAPAAQQSVEAAKNRRLAEIEGPFQEAAE